jgi:hypothetical protein
LVSAEEGLLALLLSGAGPFTLALESPGGVLELPPLQPVIRAALTKSTTKIREAVTILFI